MGKLTYHVCWIQCLDIRRNARSPIRNDASRTPRASRLIRQLPSKDRRAGLILIHDCRHIRAILRLHLRVGVEILPSDPVVRGVFLHSSIVGPVVDHRNDEFDVVFLSGSHDGVEFAETIGAEIDLGGLARDEALHPIPGSGLGDVVETFVHAGES